MEPTPLSLAEATARLAGLLRGRRTAVLTGAGCSTESGIPDYRGPGTLARARNPIQGRELRESAAVRRRYWARATIGWPRFAEARPNAAHRALAELERVGAVNGVVTQNVDRLHHAAGSLRVVELHGALAEVRCLDCGALESRDAVHQRCLTANPAFASLEARLAPDGDADLNDTEVAAFTPPRCLACGSDRLKPDVVYFGDSVPQPTVQAAYQLVDEAECLLVVGSSLVVFSGFRFVRRAAERGNPIAIVNLAPTRGDALATLVLPARAGGLLPLLANQLGQH